MGALELAGRGGRPQGRGSLLVAVAGATSLVTLLLAVPITVLAVLALVPQEQGGLGFRRCRRQSQKRISAPGSRLPTS
ncbi:PREDICTED: lymphotoxin-beta isoform X2 [Galeopterus variegatus]|uniref:Lymphotoxin-beta isoform X2 n=1 Tax=Galeopterus variegatus TaxID=482537 RepID=A0ABM0QY67_GALVR|nr:PREDICTED: lymphotoxin-beta isoform X2 [Galeopterus variegatus]